MFTTKIPLTSGKQKRRLNFQEVACKYNKMRYITFCVALVGLSTFTQAAPGGVGFIAAGASNVKPPITFDGGNVGVNFAGYSASAGLGGLLTGDVTKGGLHAEAGTPFGQSAGAGLGGVVAGGKSVGGLYAAADSGVGPAAGAGLAGSKSASASFSGSVAAATSGDAYVSKVVEHHVAPVVVQKTVQGAPTIEKTYVERTIIPNYVEKTVQVPSYVEKTIRVPTVIEKKVRVPAAPTIIEKTVDVPVEHKTFEVNAGAEVENIGTVKVIERTRPVYHKQWEGGFGGGYGSGFLGGLFGGGGGGGFNAGSFSGGGGSGGGGATYTYRKSVDSGLINDVFNIPISTLGAVSKLVGGIVGGAGGGGSLSVSKHFSTY